MKIDDDIIYEHKLFFVVNIKRLFSYAGILDQI